MSKQKQQFALSCIGIAITLLMTGVAIVHLFAVGQSLSNFPEQCALFVFTTVVLLMVYGGLVHQWARAGYFLRLASHNPTPRHMLEQIYRRAAASLCVLIPSYREELPVLKNTILSAALAEYPNRHIVVLLDDPPTGTHDEMLALRHARQMVSDLDGQFASAAKPFHKELSAYLERKTRLWNSRVEHDRLSQLYDQAASHLETWAAELTRHNSTTFAHVTQFLLDRVLYKLANDHRERGAVIRDRGCHSIEVEYRRLASLFSVSIDSFERKQFANLSHAPNKAMNLNSYIALMGKRVRVEQSPSGPLLIQSNAAQSDFNAPPAEYILTLDADSIILPDYCLRLAYILERDTTIGVVQTPYSAFPGAVNRLERIAGATTDIQYIVHQGFTAFRAGYWVGANALLRYRALLDIETESEERGHTFPVFIQDRTVIEDTGSTIDLIRRGWSVYNYTERLAYSATPPDFGSLVIQRRRWSNGGLLILPDLIRFCFGPKSNRATLQEALLRVHYLVSPAVMSFGLLVLLFFPFDPRFTYVFVPLCAIPYYLIYGLDLRLNGYRWADLVRVYALNLLLLPVNLAGVVASLRQAITGRKSPFGRTPKIEGRTVTPPVFLVFHFGTTLYLAGSAVTCLLLGRYFSSVFAATNAGMLTYGLLEFFAAPEEAASQRQLAPAE